MSAQKHQTQAPYSSDAFTAHVFTAIQQGISINPGDHTLPYTPPELTPTLAALAFSECDGDQLLHTYASFSEEPIGALSGTTARRSTDSWILCIPVPLPSVARPTLRAIEYMVKYATTNDSGNSTIQTDILLTTQPLPSGVVPGGMTVFSGVYGNEKAGYAPLMVRHETALRLSTKLAIKSNGRGEQWSHYVDSQRNVVEVCVNGRTRLYFILRVNEYPTVRTMRSLCVEVSATWEEKDSVSLADKTSTISRRAGGINVPLDDTGADGPTPGERSGTADGGPKGLHAQISNLDLSMLLRVLKVLATTLVV